MLQRISRNLKQYLLGLSVLGLLMMIVQLVYAQSSITLIERVTWSPDGRYIALSGFGFTGVVDVYENQVVLQLIHRNYETEAQHVWDARGTKLAVAADNVLQVWDINRNELLYSSHEENTALFTLTGLEWSADGRLLLTAYILPTTSVSSSVIYVRNGETYRVIERIENIPTGRMVLSYDNVYLAVSYAGPEPILINLENPNIAPLTLEGYEGRTVAFAWNRSSTEFAVGYADGKIAIWNITDLSQPRLLDSGTADVVRSVNWNPTNDQIVITSNDGRVRVLNTKTGALIYESPTRVAVSADFSPYGGQIVFGGHLITGVDQTPQLSSIPNVLQFVVPDPSLDRLNTIAESCLAPKIGVASVSDDTRLPEFVTAIEALSDDQIPPGCKADLLAVAQAIQATE
jgi:WD40 repeat protein